MKILLFCTAFSPNQGLWRLRYRRWVDALHATSLRFDQILLVDDGSSCLPRWPDLTLVSERDVANPEQLVCNDPLVLYHFEKNLGRRQINDFPGWYRSFAFAAQYAEVHGFTKVIHIESDAYLISRRMVEYVNSLASGWTAFWCPRHNFPEIAIQVIAGSEVANLAGFFEQAYDAVVGGFHERKLPYTHVARNFVGDRYSERETAIPRYVDYAAQVQSRREPEYYWWLPAGVAAAAPELAAIAQVPDRIAAADETQADALSISFGSGGNCHEYCGEGWSHQEAAFRWMIGTDSELVLPPLESGRHHVLQLSLGPCTHAVHLPRQRLRIELNGALLYTGEIAATRTIKVEIPGSVVSSWSRNVVRFIHPDATSPAALASKSDNRVLAFFVAEASLRAVDQVASSAAASDPGLGISAWGKRILPPA